MTTNTNFPTAYPANNDRLANVQPNALPTDSDRSTSVSLEQGQKTPLAQIATSGENCPKQINLARPDDKEVITFGAFDVSNLACDFSGITDTLHGVSILLSMIFREQIDHSQAKAMARAVQCTLETWENASCENIKRLNEGLKQSSFGEVQA